MRIGEKYTLKWKHPHRLEATIVEFEPDYVVCEVDHRCGFSCYLQQTRTTLSIAGRVSYSYGDFAKLFLLLNVDAIALPSGVS